MNVKNFRAKSAEECMQKLKADMGRDAVILQSRTIRPIFGRFGRPIHEIVAASDVNTVLDKLSAKAAERQEREVREEREEPVAKPQEAPRLSLSTGPAVQVRERLTLAQAAELHEKGAFDRLAAAGILREPAVMTASAGNAATMTAVAAPKQASALTEDEDRFARLEKQIAQLSDALGKAPAAAEPPVQLSVSTAPVKEPAQPKAGTAGAGGFLRYRVPAQPVTPAPAAPPAPVAVAAPPAVAAPVAPPAPAKPVGDPYAPLLEVLRKAQIAEPLIRLLRDELTDGLNSEEAKTQLHDLLAKRMLIGGAIAPTPGKVTLAALLGPTGVGKTTTIAKLAASLSLHKGVSVGMVTLDTQRVAAVQQLQTYGDILNIPVKVAYDRNEMEKILMEYALQKVEIVLIDTPGRGPMETLSLAEMSTSLRSVVDMRSYLVIPAPLSASNFDHTIVRFTQIAKPDAIILTKMDETADNHCLGFLMNAQAKYQLPLSYVTMGARVPDDLLIADAHVLVTKLLTTNMMEN